MEVKPIDAVTEAFKDFTDEDLTFDTSSPVEDIEEVDVTAETTEESTNEETMETVETTEAMDTDEKESSDTDTDDEGGDEKSNEKSKEDTEDTKKESKEGQTTESLKAPMQMKKEVVDKCWEELPLEAKQEVIRLAQENERNYKRASEAEYNIKKSREVLKPVMGYVKSVAEESHISEDEVIRNSLDIIQHLNDNPTQSAKNMIERGMILFDDPVAVVNSIIKTYGLTQESMKNYAPNQAQINLANRVAQQTYEARQNKYVKEEDYAVEDPAQAFENYRSSHPEIEGILNDPTLLDRFTKIVKVERDATPYLSHEDILNKAMEYFTFQNQPVTQQQPKEVVKPVNISEKMNKVVTPKVSVPTSSDEINNNREWTRNSFNSNADKSARSAIKQAMRDLGLSD